MRGVACALEQSEAVLLTGCGCNLKGAAVGSGNGSVDAIMDGIHASPLVPEPPPNGKKLI